MIRYAALAWLLAAAAHAQTCDFSNYTGPVVLPVHNVTLDGNRQIVQRGVRIQIGTPPQTFAMEVSP